MSNLAALTVDPPARRELLRFARATIEAYVTTRERLAWSRDASQQREADAPPATFDVLEQLAGAFVTLEKHDRLRGCIGYLEAAKPLWLAVRDAAISAAVNDPRFPPVSPDEVGALSIEISVLSPIVPCPDVSKIEVGTHGLVIRTRTHSGLLLPQVATDWGWDREQFLAHTCRKAGLPDDAWKHDAEVYWFTAYVFGEAEELPR